MATILEFRASQEKSAKSVGRRRGDAAEIVIFPGVRYERYEAADDTQPAAPAPRIVRDTLKLAD